MRGRRGRRGRTSGKGVLSVWLKRILVVLIVAKGHQLIGG